MARQDPASATAPTRPSTVVQRSIEDESGENDGEARLASTSTPQAYVKQEIFASGTEPTVPSTRFQQLPTPQNFTGNINGTNLSFSWDHISGYTLDLATAQSNLTQARNARQGATMMTNALRGLNPTESEAVMMIRQIETIGETVYTVFATTTSGNAVELTTTSANSVSLEVSLGELASYTDFFVRASFSRHGGLMSDPSNVLSHSVETINVPDMTNWTRPMVENWANENNITVAFEEQPSDTIQPGLVITTSPTRSIPVGGTLTVILSSGYDLNDNEQDIPNETGTDTDNGEELPGEPNEPVDPEPDESGVLPIEPDEPGNDEQQEQPNIEPRNSQQQTLIDENGFPVLSLLNRFRKLWYQ